ncbi:uncharacterized protein LODBEIA_P17850 [Lodderomyces beijingensis]|uniref:Vacuolar protein 14 C-terminal Fig4-binding domain-containing protein n=1 Tax=Lodderomyces beijingensis TaxID=1775926 RepID=A0ABP0ZKZ6_9ASCO
MPPQPVLEPSLIKDLSNHIYEKRKATAFQIEAITKAALGRNDSQTIYRIIQELTNLTTLSGGGSGSSNSNSNSAKMGAITALGSVSVALGSFVIAYFLEDIIKPIFATFKDTDARVRYYACESLYNVAKIARGEILLYFNEIFDVLCILVSDSESSVKNAADILDRLIKDIVSAKATNYVSILHAQHPSAADNDEMNGNYDYDLAVRSNLVDAQGNTIQINHQQDPSKAFQLPKFIPTLLERMYTIDPFTKKFLLSWLELFDDIPSLELISFLPSFLKPLIKFLFNGAPQDIKLETQNLLNVFLKEIRAVASVKLELKRKRKEMEIEKARAGKEKKNEQVEKNGKEVQAGESGETREQGHEVEKSNGKAEETEEELVIDEDASITSESTTVFRRKEIMKEGQNGQEIEEIEGEEEIEDEDGEEEEEEEEVIFGQNIYIDHSKIITILLSFLQSFGQNTNKAKNDFAGDSHETLCDVQFICLKWLQELIDIAPQDILTSVPECVAIILKNISITDEQQEFELRDQLINFSYNMQTFLNKLHNDIDAFELYGLNRESIALFNSVQLPHMLSAIINEYLAPSPIHNNELSRINSLEWLIFVYERVPVDFLKFFQSNDNGFELTDLLKYDTSNDVILKVLQLLAKISETNQEFFKDFIFKLIKLFEIEGFEKSSKVEFIIRKLCLTLNSEIIFTTLSEVFQQEYNSQPLTFADLEFTNMMIVTLNNILLTSSELLPFRRKLKTLDILDDQNWSLFSNLFQSWCFDSSSAISLCLLTCNYHLAYLIIKSLSEFEITSQLLIQLDVLVQLLESPIFIKLRLQLLEPQEYPDLYKSLYGLLMILPQSTTFMSLKNRVSTMVSFQADQFGALRLQNKKCCGSEEQKRKDEERKVVESRSAELLKRFVGVQTRCEESSHSNSKGIN